MAITISDVNSGKAGSMVAEAIAAKVFEGNEDNELNNIIPFVPDICFLILSALVSKSQNVKDIIVTPSDNGKILSEFLLEIEATHIGDQHGNPRIFAAIIIR